jgi:hypothetical protein
LDAKALEAAGENAGSDAIGSIPSANIKPPEDRIAEFKPDLTEIELLRNV